MLFKSGVLAQASGSLAGLTFTRTRSGLTLRSRSIPVNPGSGDQVAVRGIFGNLSTRWATITAAQRGAWATYAENTPVTNKLGDPLVLTGQQMYIRCNSARQRGGLAIIDDGPTTFGGVVLSPCTAVDSEGTGLVTVTFDNSDAWAGEVGGALLVYTSTDKGQGIEFFKGPFVYAGTILGAVVPPTSPDSSITSPYAHTEDNLVFYRFRAVRADGRISPVILTGGIGVVA